MSLRVKLLLLSLLTLILPWAGWQYAEQMETTLRRAQEQALITTAQILSRVVASEPELLYRVHELRQQFDPAHGDLFAPLLPTEPLMDGFADEWPIPSRSVAGFDANSPRLRLGVYRRSLHVYLEVTDSAIRYENPNAGPEAAIETDRIILLTRDEFGRERAWSVSAIAPGPVIVRACDIGAPWKPQLDEEGSHLTGVWRQTSAGYAIEIKGPLNLFGTQLAVFALGRDFNATPAPPTLAWLHTGSEQLKQRLEQYAPPGLRVSVVDTHGWLLARAGSVATDIGTDYVAGVRVDENGFAHSIYRSLLSKPEEQPHAYGIPYGMWGSPVDEARTGRETAIWSESGGGEPALVRAAVPIAYGQESLGALVVELPGEALVLVREVALTRLLNLTLVSTLIAIIVALVFAARLSHRIRRLSRAASTALTPEGRIEASIPDTQAHDELGALARSYSTLLARLKEYTNYLQTLGTKLSHELRTPLTIVSSSLENLAADAKLSREAQSYLDRARGGAARMHAILTAMTEATRVEQSIEHTERIRFDLTELVRNIGQAYSATFAKHRITTAVPEEPCQVDGSPDLIVQLLDKLMDNASDFCPAGEEIALALALDSRTCRLSVRNAGPLLPPQLDGRLFESLVSGRAGTNEKPHLGLGLYIVRLIADFHRGKVTASNLPDQSGVVIALELPRP
jgi:two-component system sensor histidine kinase ChvG